MKQIWKGLHLQRASLVMLNARLGDGGGEERQPAPRKVVPLCASDGAGAAPFHTPQVWQGQDPAQRIANTILLCAIRDGAQSVIVEPQLGAVRVRFVAPGGEREQKLPRFALGPVVHQIHALAHSEDDGEEENSSALLRLLVDEKLYEVQLSVLNTDWGDGVTMRFSSQE